MPVFPVGCCAYAVDTMRRNIFIGIGWIFNATLIVLFAYHAQWVHP